MSVLSCLTFDELSNYVLCSCDDERSQQLENHLEQCATCQALLAEIIESGAAPSFLRFGRMLHQEPITTQVATTEDVESDAALGLGASRTIPDSIAQYRITSYIGGGGMGVVYSAWDEKLNRPVALKLLKRQTERSSRARRMLQEAAALGRLSHPNIVTIYEVLSYESQPVLSMELVEGQNLARWLDGQLLAAQPAAELVFKLASALHYAHSKGVVHRDLKPANVMLEYASTQDATLNDLPELVPKITDFGLAKLVDENMMTHTGDLLGTPAYMAPEQVAGESNSGGPSIDIYALGVILYELLTGRTPFIAADTLQTLALISHATPVSPRVHNARVPRDLETICMKCLEKSTADRYATASALADDLGAFIEGYPVSARSLSSATKAWRWINRNRILSVALFCAALSLCGMAIGSAIVATREKVLRTRADQLLAVAETSERQKAKQLDDAIMAASRLFDAFPSGSAEHEHARAHLYKMFQNHAALLGPVNDWTVADANFIEIYCRLLDAKSNERRELLDQQLVVTGRLCAQFPEDELYHRLAAQALGNRALISLPVDELMMDQALEHAEKAMVLSPNQVSRAVYASLLSDLSEWLFNDGRYEESYTFHLKSLPALTKMAQTEPTPNNQINLAERLVALARTCCKLQPCKPCGKYLNQASKLVESLQSHVSFGEKAKSVMNEIGLQRELAASLKCID